MDVLTVRVPEDVYAAVMDQPDSSEFMRRAIVNELRGRPDVNAGALRELLTDALDELDRAEAETAEPYVDAQLTESLATCIRLDLPLDPSHAGIRNHAAKNNLSEQTFIDLLDAYNPTQYADSEAAAVAAITTTENL